jgi:hypothetical protein
MTFLSWGEVSNSGILNVVGRNSLLGNRKKIAKFLMRTFTCCSTFLYVLSTSKQKNGRQWGEWKYTCLGKALTLYILHDKLIRHREIILDATLWSDTVIHPNQFSDCIAE